MNSYQIADLIVRFLNDQVDLYEWDDFLCLNDLGSTDINQLQSILSEVWVKFPAEQPGHYCSDLGLKFLLKVSEVLLQENWSVEQILQIESELNSSGGIPN